MKLPLIWAFWAFWWSNGPRNPTTTRDIRFCNMTPFWKFTEGVSNYLYIECGYVAGHFGGWMSLIDLLVHEKIGFVIWPLFKNVSYGCQITFNRKRGPWGSFWWSNDPLTYSESWDIFWCNLTPWIVIWQVSCYISLMKELPRIILRPKTLT